MPSNMLGLISEVHLENILTGMREQPSGCIYPHVKPNKKGYCYVQIGGREEGQRVRVHRLIWEYHYGSIPDGADVLHSCDDRRCCNPDHLNLGDPMQNTADMYERGRARNQYGPHGRKA